MQPATSAITSLAAVALKLSPIQEENISTAPAWVATDTSIPTPQTNIMVENGTKFSAFFWSPSFNIRAITSSTVDTRLGSRPLETAAIKAESGIKFLSSGKMIITARPITIRARVWTCFLVNGSGRLISFDTWTVQPLKIR